MNLTENYDGGYLIIVTLHTDSGTQHVLYYGLDIAAPLDPDSSQAEGENQSEYVYAIDGVNVLDEVIV